MNFTVDRQELASVNKIWDEIRLSISKAAIGISAKYTRLKSPDLFLTILGAYLVMSMIPWIIWRHPGGCVNILTNIASLLQHANVVDLDIRLLISRKIAKWDLVDVLLGLLRHLHCRMTLHSKRWYIKLECLDSIEAEWWLINSLHFTFGSALDTIDFKSMLIPSSVSYQDMLLIVPDWAFDTSIWLRCLNSRTQDDPLITGKIVPCDCHTMQKLLRDCCI